MEFGDTVIPPWPQEQRRGEGCLRVLMRSEKQIPQGMTDKKNKNHGKDRSYLGRD
jgi:hypothetical protein